MFVRCVNAASLVDVYYRRDNYVLPQFSFGLRREIVWNSLGRRIKQRQIFRFLVVAMFG